MATTGSIRSNLVRRLSFVFIAVAFVPSLVQGDTARELQLAVNRLTDFIGNDENAANWRRYLNLNVLEAQAARGNAADVAQLVDCLQRFDSGASGLDHPKFKDTRNALLRHIQVLRDRDAVQPGMEVDLLRTGYRPISKAEIEYRRDRAVYDLVMLKRYYRNADTEVRDRLLQTLKIDEVVATLQAIEIKLPGEPTEQQIDEELAELRARADRLAQETGNLNQQLAQIQELVDAINQGESTEGDAPQPVEDVEPAKAVPADQVADAEQAKSEEVENERQRVELETRLRNLQTEAEGIEARIARLELMKQDRAVQDEEYLKWRTEVAREINPVKDAFEELMTDYRDVYFASAWYSFSTFRQVFGNGTNPRLEAFVNSNIDRLAKVLPSVGDPLDRESQAELGKVLGNLEHAGQSPHVLAALRQRYSMPNLAIHVGSGFVNRLANRPVSDTEPVREIILGRLIKGTAWVNGSVDIDFVDDPNQAHLSLHLNGHVNSSTYTREGPITAYAGGNALIEARRSIYVSPSMIYLNRPYGAANLQSQFHGTSCRLRIVNRIAQKQYLKDKRLSEGISAGRLERRTIARFEEQTETAFREGASGLGDVRDARKENLGVLPAMLLNTSRNRLNVIGHMATTNDIGALTQPNDYPEMRLDVAMRLHESLASNYFTPLLSGKAMTNEEIADRLESALQVDMQDLRESENGDWTILFSDKRPVQFEFDGNRVAVVVTGLRFRQDRNTINTGLKIRLRFRIVLRNDELYLTRDGKAEIEYMDAPDGKTVAFKSALERQLNKGVEDGTAPDIGLPRNFIPLDREPFVDSDIAYQMRLVQLRFEQGWAYVGWRQAPSEFSPATGPVDTPAIWPVAQEAPDAADDSSVVPAPVDNTQPPVPDDD